MSKIIAVWFAFISALAGNGEAATNQFAATQQAVQQPIIEHMKVIDSSGTSYQEVWYNPANWDTRTDDVVNNTLTERTLFLGKKTYSMFLVKGKVVGQIGDLPNKLNTYEPTLFTFIANRYKTKEWADGGTVTVNGEKVKKVKNVVKIKETTVTYAYLDMVTGLPIKEEIYVSDSKGKLGLSLTRTYVFNRVSDPKNMIFSDFAGATLQ